MSGKEKARFVQCVSQFGVAFYLLAALVSWLLSAYYLSFLFMAWATCFFMMILGGLIAGDYDD